MNTNGPNKPDQVDTPGPTAPSVRPTDAAAIQANAQRAADAEEQLAEATRNFETIAAQYADVKGAESSVNAAQRALQALKPATSRDGALATSAMFVFGLSVWASIGLAIGAFFSEGAKRLLDEYWIWLAALFAGSMILYAAAQQLAAWRRGTSADVARKVFAQIAVPSITVALMGLIGFGSTHYYSIAAQLILIAVAALLPAVTYFLFLTARRPSMLNEFIGNLGRLGLLARRPGPDVAGQGGRRESDEERRSRVESYFQRFESIYGALRFDDESGVVTRSDLVDRLIKATDQPELGLRLPKTTVFIGDLFHANLIIPIGLVTILTTLGWLLVLQPDLNATGAIEVADIVPKLTAVNFGFLGAYFFGIQMLFRRFVRRDLGPNAYFSFANRVILTVIGVWMIVAAFDIVVPTVEPVAAAVASLSSAAASAEGQRPAIGADAEASAATAASAAIDAASGAPALQSASSAAAPAAAAAPGEASAASAAAGAGSAGSTSSRPASQTTASAVLVLAFIVGFFPRVLWQFLSAAVTKVTYAKVVLPSLESEQPLKLLDGLTVWHVTRLEEEDVENVPNMASVDVVELMLYTQIPMERLIGWIDQAILLCALGNADGTVCKGLRQLGLRSATQVIAVADDATARAKVDSTLGKETLDTLVLALQKEANVDVVRAWRQV